MGDFFAATLDASLRCYEIVQVHTDEDGTERGRGASVTMRWCCDNDYETAIKEERGIENLLDRFDVQWQNLLPGIDLTFTLPVIDSPLQVN